MRVKAGSFLIENSIKLDELDSKEIVDANLIYPLEYLEYPKYEITESQKIKVANGNSLSLNCEDGLILLTCGETLAAVAEIVDGKAVMRKVFL